MIKLAKKMLKNTGLSQKQDEGGDSRWIGYRNEFNWQESQRLFFPCKEHSQRKET